MKKGFTLTELILVVLIIGVLAAMSAPFISAMIDAWTFNRAERDLVFSSRLALNRMVREIRQGWVDNTTFANSTFFNFTDFGNNSVSFYQSGNYLYRNSDVLSDKLISPGGLNMTYYNSTGDATTNATQIRKMDIRMNMELDGNNITVGSWLKLRNTF